ncbi:hypothetical protein ACHAXT_006984 [Thalassiosira profunda]
MAAPAELTPFQTRVYNVVGTIPKGSVRTYGSIAKELGTCARAVGTAMGRNPYGPCDRETPEVRRKRMLLEGEGIEFEEDGKGSSKIQKQFFVDAPSSSDGTKAKTGAARGAKKRITSQNDKPSATKSKKSKYFSAASEDMLKREILNLLEKRQPGKTC